MSPLNNRDSTTLSWATLCFVSLLAMTPIAAFAANGSPIRAILESKETLFFVSAILFLTIYFGHIRFTRFSLAHGPEILTTAGIMGCFFGIAMALLDFDTKNVQQSVPMLLQGVKTAFWSSLAGVAGALYLRFLHHVRKAPAIADSSSVKAANLDDVVSTLAALRAGLVGNEQGTLLSQMKLQRQESNDKMDELIREFKNFASHMVENNQKAFIEALRQVIADFNQKITEQFGENFKQLNAAVEKLVIWQQQYKEELDQLKSVQIQTASAMNLAANNITEVVSRAERFASVADSLSSTVSLLSKQVETLYQQEQALAATLTTMKDVTPQFAEKVDSMLKQLTTGIAQVQSEMTAVMKNLGTQIQSSNAEMKNLLADTLKVSQKEVGESLQQHVKIIKEGVLTLDKALQQELNNSLETLGRQLASLSNKFVEDYTPLTDKLREVVQITRRV